MSPFVQLAFDGPLARLTLKRGDKLNALDQAMIHALADAARTIDEADRSARHDLEWRRQGVLRRRRHWRLGCAAAVGNVAELDTCRSSRV